jgi:hypothetical protein
VIFLSWPCNLLPPSAPRSGDFRERSEEAVGCEGQKYCGNGSQKNKVGGGFTKTLKDELPETTGADQGCNNGVANGLYARYAYATENYR